jgi:hypothetical protein
VRAATCGTGKAAGVGAAGAGVARAEDPVSSFILSPELSGTSVPWTFCAEEGGGEERGLGRTGRFFHSVSKTF